jgi:hypothetical protein
MNVHLVLPFPPKGLNPNERPNRYEKAAVIRDYRGQCCIYALQARNRKTIALQAPVQAWVTFICKDKLWDQDNAIASLKAMWDGIVDSGLIPGDSPDLLSVSTEVIKGDKAAVLVRLEDGQ